MSDEAKKKAATAAKQVGHAVSNIEDAAELQVEEVVQTIVDSKPVRTISANSAVVIGAGLFVGGAVAHHLLVKGLVKFHQKREEKARKGDNGVVKAAFAEEGSFV